MKRLLIILVLLSIYQWSNGQKYISKVPNSLKKSEYEIIDSLAKYHFELGNDSVAKIYCKQSLDLKEKRFGKNSQHYATSLCLLAEIELDIDNDSEALFLAKESQRIRKMVLGEKCSDYVNSLNVLAEIYYSMAKYNEAQKTAFNAYNLCHKYVPKEDPEYARSLNVLALSKHAQGCYNDAILYGLEALNLRAETQGKESADYLQSLGNLAGYNSYAGNYVEAIRLGMEEAYILKKKYGSINLEYARCLNNLGFFNTNLGNYAEALRLFNEALGIRENLLGKESPRYVMTLNNIAFCHSELGHKQKAVEIGEEVVKLYRAKYDNSHSDCGMALINLAVYYGETGDYEKALAISKEAADIYRNVYGDNHPDYAIALGNIAKIQFSLGNISEAYSLSVKALQIKEKALGLEHPDVAVSLKNQSFYAYYLKLFGDAFKFEKRATDILLNHIKHNFSLMSSFRRKHYWEIHKKDFCEFYPSLVYYNQNPESISELFDKTALFAKGILLSTDIEMRELIVNSEDSLILNDYLKLVSNKEYYNKLIESQNENEINMDSLILVIQEQEDKIVTKSRVYGDFTHNLNVSWKEIQKRLNEKDIAIEFLDFPIGTDSVMYIALTLKKDYKYPHLISLFEVNQIKSIPKNDYYRTSHLAKLIWGALGEELAGVKNVLFSPSGELHRIGIEYLPLNDVDYIFDKYQMYRLSSTRQIALGKRKPTRKQAVLYGGIDYNTSSDYIPYNEKIFSEKQVSIVGRLQVDSLPVRGSRAFLLGTKIEADNISTNLKKHNWFLNYYTGSKGTEKNFKMMSGKCPSLLHIATHGFYMTENDARKELEIAMIEGKRSIDRHQPFREDKPMTRSGLLLAGCNHALNHEPIPENSEDGILTAQEIASLDFRGLDLVVLSACETGLGDISSGEGVFGLQRGFKKAGANTIIMSLWKVSDKATESLMIYFYQNYLNGMSKYKAFTTAREKLRKESPPRQNKPDWAAFIMLDGIN